jgi:predicted RNA-binding protein with PIN domain
MNVIGSRPTGWWRDRPAAIRELVDRLHAFSRKSGEHVTVVFDGRPRDVPGGPGQVEVAFATRRGRDAADHDIAERVAAREERAGLRVVTSDSALAARVRELGAEVVSAGAFLRRLDEAEPGG